MIAARARRLALPVLVTVLLAGLATVATVAVLGWSAGPGGYGGMMGGGPGGMMGRRGSGGMMGGGYAVPGDGHRVGSLGAAAGRAQVFADRLGLRVGEVMQFSNGFYAQLRTADGAGATEVLVDAATGAVSVEVGPAMMWNTRYGMPAVGQDTPVAVSAEASVTVAQRWLDDQRPGLTAAEPDAFPGYFTLHALRGGAVVGMLSVNAGTGAVWYHTWHGSFVAMRQG